MKKFIGKVSAAAMSAAMILGNGVILNASAAEGDAVTTTEAAVVTTVQATATEAAATTTEAATTQAPVATETTTVTTAEATTTAPATTTAQVSTGFVAGTYYSSSAKYQGYNTYSFASDGKSGSYINSVAGSTVTFTISYANPTITLSFSDGTSKTGNITNIASGATVSNFTITWNSGEVETFSTTPPASAVTTTTFAAAATTTSVGSTTAASTTKAVTTTAKPNKNDSPKTGDSFPALAMTAALLTAAGLSFATKKRSK